ncbi:hypothetical protein O7599_00015 [Streptomyces sp. WMMC500]|uniref:hypothetical protein n=1 Tax=Streptomyces sp. WMMC500 TaxID=3015154 RepID=UPI00248C0A9A|nr:hypothetical protein [Streptomyces sp. WMMC500]WBB60990.1 hypothetical protein O7599_00015 [Streptomyces sp. WMMC500]
MAPSGGTNLGGAEAVCEHAVKSSSSRAAPAEVRAGHQREGSPSSGCPVDARSIDTVRRSASNRHQIRLPAVI